jgi:hypothetical protein
MEYKVASKIGDVVQDGRGSKSHIKKNMNIYKKVVSRKEKINRWYCHFQY